LNGYKIKYLIVGAYAVIYYTEPRYTKDLDIWIFPDLNDHQKVYDALKEFGAPLRDISPNDFKEKKMIYQIGVAPVRVDIKMDVEGLDFKKAWKNKKKITFGKTPVFVVGFDDLIKAKKAMGRPQDMLDIQKLQEHSRKK
jgi:hypothetical protein